MTNCKIAVITATRAEYGLFHPVLKEIEADPDLELHLVATGTHLKESFGNTLEEIEKDGFQVTQTKDVFSESDTPLDIAQNFAHTNAEIAALLDALKPNILLTIGDRYEMLAFTTAAFLMHIPIAHIAGGEITTGALDDSIRHAITKLSNIHFPATESYAKRIIQMGEDPAHVHVVGSTGVENILNVDFLGKDELETATGFTFGKRNLLATFHPVTTEAANSQAQLEALFAALDQHPDIHVLFTMPNADEGGATLAATIEQYIAADPHPPRLHYIKSLGFKNYLSALNYVDGVIGNSSSGIIEAPSFKIGTINIGSRQDGRVRAGSIIDCAPETELISQAINYLYADDFQAYLKTAQNPFFKEGTSATIKDILKNTDLQTLSAKKFHDVRFEE